MVSGEQIKKYLGILNRVTGIDVSQYKDDFFARQVSKRMQELHCNADAYLKELNKNKSESARLLDNLTVYHTSFFRDMNKYLALKETVFPDILAKGKKKKSIKIWSAGCAGGEEPYSIAILLYEYLGSRIEDWHVEIYASDMNDALLNKARAGVFPLTELSRKDMPADLLHKYFYTIDEENYSLHDGIKSLINFDKHNLIKDAFPADIDLILCRNVLIYIKYEFVRKVLNKFHRVLNDGCFLVLGNFESIDTSFITLYERVKSNNEFIYRKITEGSAMHQEMIKKQKSIEGGLGIKGSA